MAVFAVFRAAFFAFSILFCSIFHAWYLLRTEAAGKEGVVRVKQDFEAVRNRSL